jgi:hypothetical protein
MVTSVKRANRIAYGTLRVAQLYKYRHSFSQASPPPQSKKIGYLKPTEIDFNCVDAVPNHPLITMSKADIAVRVNDNRYQNVLYYTTLLIIIC